MSGLWRKRRPEPMPEQVKVFLLGLAIGVVLLVLWWRT